MKKLFWTLVVGVIGGAVGAVAALHCPAVRSACAKVCPGQCGQKCKCDCGCEETKTCNCQGEKKMECPKAAAMAKLKAYKHEDYYKDGKFDPAAAKEAYYTLMTAHGFPIYPMLKTDAFWVCDFAQNEFEKVGMGGNFWVNLNYEHEMKGQKFPGGYLGHEIYLLPGQMIAEHWHDEKADDNCPAKRESWLVRYGNCYSCSVEDADKIVNPIETCPAKISENQKTKGYITCNNWVEVKPGETATMNGARKKHFLIAGPEGAIITEIGTYHTNAQFADDTFKF